MRARDALLLLLVTGAEEKKKVELDLGEVKIDKDALAHRKYYLRTRYVFPCPGDYVDIRTNEVNKFLLKRGFVFLNVSRTTKGPLFCGEKALMEEFCKTNDLKPDWVDTVSLMQRKWLDE